MNIADLDFIVYSSEESSLVKGGVSVIVSSSSTALGSITFARAFSRSVAVDIPFGGSLGVGYSYSLAYAYDPPSIPTYSIDVQ
ncbi:MAG: hypothetical protein AAGF93_07140 [Cyanobacteria bacterium P01_H01_bin.105]